MRRKRLLLALVAGGLLALLAALPAYAELGKVSPHRSRATGFPNWYADQSAPAIKVKLCIDSRFCLGGNNLINEATGRRIKDDNGRPCRRPNVRNGCMPDEAFYAVSRAETELVGGGRIRWRAVLEGAFGGNGAVRPGRQITFTRVQVTGSNINTRRYRPGTLLKFVTPYGNLRSRVTQDGTLNRVRLESPLGTPRNGFEPPVAERRTGYGPRFMRWNAGRPNGFLGNPLRLHKAVGGSNPEARTRRGLSTFQAYRVVRRAPDPRISPLVKRFEIAGQIVR